jgi:hypothetical protein
LANVTVQVEPGVGVAVGVGVGVGVAGVGVGDTVAVGVGVGVAGGGVGVAGVGVTVGVGDAVGVGDGPPPVMVKFVSEISKKILPTASTLTRAVVVGVLGIRSDSVPSLGVFAARTVGNVVPPSVEREILTFAVLTGASVVLATFQVIVWDEPPAHDTFVLGAVTLNGPALLVTVTVVLVNWVWPIFTPVTYGLLSLTVNLKFNVLATELNASMFATA